MSADPELIASVLTAGAPPRGAAAADPPASAAARAPRRRAGGLPPGAGLLLPVGVLLLVELAARAGWIAPQLLPPPSEVAQTLLDLARQGVLSGHIVASTGRVLAGFALGTGLALGFGALTGLSRTADALLTPSFQALRAIPSLAWVPLLLLWLGIDEASKIVLIAIGAFFPVYMGTVSGIAHVDRKLVEVARLRGFGGLTLARRVLLPAAMPSLMTGLRNGLSLAWMFMVAAELIAASRGLGYLLTDGRETSRADLVLAAIALLAVLGKLSDSLMATVERRVLHWRDTFGGGA